MRVYSVRGIEELMWECVDGKRLGIAHCNYSLWLDRLRWRDALSGFVQHEIELRHLDRLRGDKGVHVTPEDLKQVAHVRRVL